MRIPAYLNLPGEVLKQRFEEIRHRASPCILCPRHCRVHRMEGEKGFCKTGILPIISSYGPHHGEEEPISGKHGSGTIFFTHCTMQCIFCQNLEISRGFSGQEIPVETLAEIYIRLQDLGCHNINLVTPSHQLPAILEALILAIEKGLHIPLVYNTGGYDDPITLRLLDGIIDIYMPDFKFSDPAIGKILAGVPDYPEQVKSAIREMHNQVGDLQIEGGIAVRGLLIRYLILPGFVDECTGIFRFIAEDISRNTWVNIMDQYHPAGDVREYCPENFPSLQRRILNSEVKTAYQIAAGFGLSRGFTQFR